MIYNLYFHNDFDGIASTAILMNFLKAKGDKIAAFYPVQYPINFKAWEKISFKKPTIIVDFIYHPKAKIWFDHHPTAFIKDSWRKNFRAKKLLRWDCDYKSCSSLILDSLKKDFKFRPKKFLLELAKWSDKIDKFAFKNPRESISFKKPAMKLFLLLDNFSVSKKILGKIIKSLATKPLRETSKIKELKLLFKKIDKEIKKSWTFYRKNIKISNKVAFINETENNCLKIRPIFSYLSFKAPYSIIFNEKSKSFGLTVGKNPWKKINDSIHIGNFLRKNYGGGGHQNIGGVNFPTKTKALKAIKEIENFLNK